MRKTEGASKASGKCGYWKHLRQWGKRLANKASRKYSKSLTQGDTDGEGTNIG